MAKSENIYIGLKMNVYYGDFLGISTERGMFDANFHWSDIYGGSKHEII